MGGYAVGMRIRIRHALAAFALAALSACGGAISIHVGDDDDGFHEVPHPSGLAASVAVTGATDAALDGAYASGDVWLSSVVRTPGGSPDTCWFAFSGLLQQSGGGRLMDGEIRYLPFTSDVAATRVVINGFEFRADGTAGATADRGAREVRYAGAVLRSPAGGQVITFTGTLPMRREDSPAGC